MSASDHKAVEGQSRPSDPMSKPVDQGTVLGIGTGQSRGIEGKPSLVMNVRGKELDTWNDVLNGAGAKELEQVLSRAKIDEFYDMTNFIRGVEYQGFDRLFYIKYALSKMSVSVFSRFAIIGAIRGSNFAKIRENCESMPNDLITGFDHCGFVKTPKKKTDLTILRNTASIPHWCVYWCQKADVGKKIPTSDCPAPLQFPGAASLPMSHPVRMKHLKFCVDFSQLLPGGRFNVSIYLTAMRNAIPISDIPQEVLAILEVKSTSENYILTEEDVAPYSKSLIVTR
jgi:hypothetical protein